MKRGVVAQPVLGVERSADVPGPNVRGAWSLCLVREETASTKVVLWSRVLVLRGIDEGFAAYFSWLRAESFVNELDLRLVSAGGSCRRAGRAPCVPFCVTRFFVLLVALSREGFVPLSLWGLVPGSLVGSRGRPGFVVSPVVFEELVHGVFVDFAEVWYLGRFRGIFRVAACPPGGEICGMYFRHLPQLVFHSGG